jgi:hypothetical protein
MGIPKTSMLPPAGDLSGEAEGKICENCGNVYRIERLKEGDDYNDFGQRYCPFCGLLTNEW